jgi:diguanylate cyclase (GGDEF)-like protein/PAS domain S-box-containing protein
MLFRGIQPISVLTGLCLAGGALLVLLPGGQNFYGPLTVLWVAILALAYRNQQAKDRKLYEKTPAMLHSVDDQGRLVNVSDFWLETLGRRRQEVLGRPLTDFFSERSRQLAQRVVLPEFFRSGQVQDIPYQMLCKDGRIIEVLLSAAADRDWSGKIKCSMAVATDVTSVSRVEHEMLRLSYIDHITGLPNRGLLEVRISQALGDAQRQHQQLTLFSIHLDRLAGLNDTLGHATGDLLLQEASRRLSDWLPAGASAARLEGDRFAVVLPTADGDSQQALTAAQKMLELLCRPFSLDDREFFRAVNIGIAIYPQDGRDVESLLLHAELAGFAAKELGQKTWRFYTPELGERAANKLEMATRLRRAQYRGELSLVYQPQVDLLNGGVIGVEALLRWDNPELGCIPPDHFIPVAEEIGLIHELGDWVLRTACAQARAWQEEGLPALRMAVNVSGQQFAKPDFIDGLDAILKETGFDPNRLELEITESTLMTDARDMIPTLTDLKVRGIHLAIDDFGTGYSSLNYLKKFPFDRIKIAQEFVRGLPADDDGAAIVEAVLAIADRLGLLVLAEGVETREQLDFLRERQCAEAQGYYFARPMPAAELAALLAQGSDNPGSRLVALAANNIPS